MKLQPKTCQATRTGARREESVMFSLSALQDLRAVEPLPVRAETTSDSGLIDIAARTRDGEQADRARLV